MLKRLSTWTMDICSQELLHSIVTKVLGSLGCALRSERSTATGEFFRKIYRIRLCTLLTYIRCNEGFADVCSLKSWRDECHDGIKTVLFMRPEESNRLAWLPNTRNVHLHEKLGWGIKDPRTASWMILSWGRKSACCAWKKPQVNYMDSWFLVIYDSSSMRWNWWAWHTIRFWPIQ